MLDLCWIYSIARSQKRMQAFIGCIMNSEGGRVGWLIRHDSDEWLKPMRRWGCRCWGFGCQVMIWDLFPIQHQWKVKVFTRILDPSKCHHPGSFKVLEGGASVHNAWSRPWVFQPKFPEDLDITSLFEVYGYVFRKNQDVDDEYDQQTFDIFTFTAPSGACRCTRIFGASTQPAGG